ncbi:MAG: hypothetical protein J6P60_02730 [Lachnospiraceae bacterium]|nr:hypothetical protein [Lachnospiraceae bacterium]
MSLLDRLSDESCWNQFYEYKISLACPGHFERELRDFIDRKAYLPVCERIYAGERFPLPKRSMISKHASAKKRMVYTYPHDENIVLKLLTYLLLRRYDEVFEDNLFSFRPGKCAKDAIRRLKRTPDMGRLYSYKVDIHDYFNSVPIPVFLPLLKQITADDPKLYEFLCGLLQEPCAVVDGNAVACKKGIMAGTPLASFYANLYLRELDHCFAKKHIPYARYSDDIILFAMTREEIEKHATFVRDFLSSHGLSVNPDKECFAGPKDGWTFLGFSFREDVIDIAPVTVKKLKQKMRRKRDALMRWRVRGGHSPENAARAFIRVFNRKLLESSGDNELTWSYWFFSVIGTTESLREIDLYAQDCIRYLVSGKHTKARFKVRYEDMKNMGYRSLVHAYYEFTHSLPSS